MSKTPVPQRVRWLGLLTALLFAVAGCSVAPAQTEPGFAPADGGDVRAEPQATAAPAEGGPTPERQVSRTGSLTVRVGDVLAAATELQRLALLHDGFVSAELLAMAEDGAGSRVTVSVPADRLDAFMTDAARVGELLNRSLTAKDVTEQVIDVEARIRTLRESITRIRALLGRAGSVADIAQVEAELTRRQSDLESMLAQQQALKDRVERAPVTVTLTRAGQVVPPDNPFLTGLQRAWVALQQSIALLLTVLGALVPFVVLAGLIAAPVVVMRRRRAAARAAAAGTATGRDGPTGAAGREAEPAQPAGDRTAPTTPATGTGPAADSDPAS